MTAKTIKEKLENDRTQMLRLKGTPRGEMLAQIPLRAIRAALNEITNAEIGKTRRELSEDEVIQILRKAVKQREESAAIYLTVGAESKSMEESLEAEVIRGYLPELLTPEDTKTLVEGKIIELGITSIRQMGQLMGVLSSFPVDKSIVSRIAKEILS